MSIFTGTAGDDSIAGTEAGDDFHLEQGGNDTASGGGGVDIFYMGAAFTADDQIDGGAGNDILVLDGDYSAGVSFGATTLANVERINLAAGYDYSLSGFAAFTDHLKIDGSGLGAGDSLSVDASAATGPMSFTGGLGADRLTGGSGNDELDGGGAGKDVLDGGAGNDRFYLGTGVDVARGGDGGDQFYFDAGDFSVRDKIDGGDGGDAISLSGTFEQALVLRDTTFVHCESIDLHTGALLHLTATDALVDAGVAFQVSGQSSQGLDFDGSTETDGAYRLYGANEQSNTLVGGAGADSIFGGLAADTLTGGGGDDSLSGGSGADKLVGGLGQDTLTGGIGADRFFFLDVEDSTADAPDLITDFNIDDVIWLQGVDADSKKAGNQAFHLVDAFTGHRGELVVTADAPRHLTTISGDVDGDGTADLVIELTGKHADPHFVL